MVLAELITLIQSKRPSEYNKDELTQWVNEVEFMAVDQVLNKAEGNDITFEKYHYNDDAEKELLIPDQFNGVYTSYLFSKIDFNYGETERYQLEAALFNSEWQAYSSWYRRTKYPKRLSTAESKPITTESIALEST